MKETATAGTQMAQLKSPSKKQEKIIELKCKLRCEATSTVQKQGFTLQDIEEY